MEDFKKENPVYICDPKKNKECKKTICQTMCFRTTNWEYAIDEEQVERGQ